MAHPDITPEMRRWVETWKAAGPELAAIRREEVRTMDNVLAVQQLGDCFNDATLNHPPRESSGLVEMQRLFAKCHSK
jgi:hypothetical protein